ncbi:MBL fold metallo-hydrolase [Halobaculum magnesiiphilum]|uniref:MBL fold metallo-hydrolase n=1 Tax=Halobaculum magnesiiphilum TaxID=1017351 RepID=A0A8T8WFC4_9EURY|nr:MBL fold metallo-hydrolase [Halobaculum magnesiiphilum]QZP38557.1 MBL fold metallo-hydrolase [Halobaculum magnesiiphilum]
MVEGVYRFGSRRINWYVLEADEGLTIVDAGLPDHWPQLVDWLDRTGHELDDIAGVVLTHADVDHVGFARILADRGVPVYCHPDDVPLLRSHPQSPPGWYLRNLWRPRFAAYAIEMLRNGVRSVDPVPDVDPLVPGETLPVPGEPRVIFAPGHTPGSCALFVEDRDTLFCGDVLATRNIFTQREGDPQLLGPADEDHAEAAESLARLGGLGTVTLLPGHGDPWRGEIDTAIALAR